jgi:hypothetical protein
MVGLLSRASGDLQHTRPPANVAAMPSARKLQILGVATAIACPLFLYGLYVDSLSVRLPTKPWPHLLLIAWLVGGPPSRYAGRVAAAVALCMVADVLLELRQTLFAYGIGVFFSSRSSRSRARSRCVAAS